MKRATQHLSVVLLMAILFTACNRPVAYFQKSPREQYATLPAAPIKAIATSEVVAATPVANSASATESAGPTTQAEALHQANALVSNNSKTIADKSVQKRIQRVQTLLAAASLKAPATASVAGQSRKAGFVERMMVKKLNRKISRQLAPANPNKPMISTSILATGAVLVLIGLLLLLLTTGTGATVGVILLVAGAVLLLVGLF